MAELIGLLPGCPASLPGVAVSDDAEARSRQLALVLGMHEGRLSLWRPGGQETPLAVEFNEGKQGYRLSHERVRHERLIKALGKPREAQTTVLDATAGLGRDAALMAMAGFQVLLCERSPVVHALLADGLARAPSLAERMLLLPCEDALAQPTEPLHAVYLDPMFPAREKSAAVKKDLQWLQWLCPYPQADEERRLMDWALSLPARRVIVKRPARAPLLAGRTPGFSQKGKAVRFDVYPRG
ncbi:hypothetical protein A11A3_05339 [Alcanivorax hongdengensis A-11-3]|uniref:Ribosomal RNA small subunit methyltransferase J n=1 Tax=Alcanivorax hongdengensis A-11-3 TaxID=1177179 RepID=L0WGX8_9GAMM|nr:class I SAM-dependent methyltransferase [Alcanivorax hongdengensis]EKF75090.1 hypothetical protein A11A3_05339 [Alcanivorax hongdengensis A-11-3]